MENITQLDQDVEKRAFNKTDLKELWELEQEINVSLKQYNKSLKNKPPTVSKYTEKDAQKQMADLKAWQSHHKEASDKLHQDAQKLTSRLLKTVAQSDRDKELAHMNVNGLQNLVKQLNSERDLIMAGVEELNTVQGLDSNLKLEYRSQYYHYIVFFIVMIIIGWLLIRIQLSHESSAVELVILIAAVLVLVYHFYNWIWAVADDFWDWLNGLFNF